MVLEKILAQKRLEIQKIPNYHLKEEIIPSFRLALLSSKGSIIAECKKGSPSKGVIQPDYNPVELAKEYERCGAVAISVLTDEKFFFGSLSHLQAVAQAVKLPVLRKDFILDEKQILEARYFGASAVLLIVRILSFDRLKELYFYAKSIGLDVLVEVHTLEEAKLALEIGAEIIGINTRDLDTLQIHKDIIDQIAKFLPKDVICVGESGISSRQDYLDMLPYVQSVLIGTYFMEKKKISTAFQELLAIS